MEQIPNNPACSSWHFLKSNYILLLTVFIFQNSHTHPNSHTQKNTVSLRVISLNLLWMNPHQQ